jgi:putative tricarboxylic transport membrane protein
MVPSRLTTLAWQQQRRACLGAAVAALSGPALARRPPGFRMTVPAAPAGGWDKTAQALGAALQAAGVVDTVGYDYLAGASGSRGLFQFIKDRVADSEALLVMGSVMVAGLIAQRAQVQLSQATAIARLTSEYNVFVVLARSPWRNLGEVLESCRRAPERVRWGGGSVGSTEHIASALVGRALGVSPAKWSYLASRGGGEAAQALMAGQVEVSGGSYSEYADLIADGTVRALAVTSPHRLKGLDVPTLREWGLDVELGGWRGVYAPPGLHAEQRQALIDKVVAATSTRSWSNSLERHRWTASLLTGQAFEEFVDRETATLRQLLIRAGLI